MGIKSLIKKLDEIGVPKRYYSINGGLFSDTYILNQVYGKWECFYFDEKGNKNNYMTFNNEHEACIHMLHVLEKEMNDEKVNYE